MSSIRPSGATAALVLENGQVFWGQGLGAFGAPVGEVCFNTSLTGYQEVMTDPSYAGQLINFTFPHIGNVGTNATDEEARRPFALGCILRDEVTTPSSWRAHAGFDIWLKEKGLSALAGVDTRALTHVIRAEGAPRGVLVYADDGTVDLEAAVAKARAWHGLKGMDLAAEVTTQTPYSWTQGVWRRDAPNPSYRVVALDLGAKQNILRCLVDAGCDLQVLPASASHEDILSHKPEGLFLSNGPGDPAATGTYVERAIQGVLDAGVPVFGICLGHQILARALGGETVKLHQGHRGANHPVQELSTGKIEITSQNHGFAVDESSLPEDVEVTHRSLFDGTNEGIRSLRYPAFSVQYHPEASPGPQDSQHLFQRFTTLMRQVREGSWTA